MKHTVMQSDFACNRTDQRMILRTGVDIVQIERIRRAISRYEGTAPARKRFLERLYTEAELRHCRDRVESLAARFAAKEANRQGPGNRCLA